MNPPLRVLIVEDSHKDADLLVHALRRGGYEVTSAVVETPEAMRTALERQAWDVILSDHALPGFSAPAALALARDVCPDVPFLIVSGDINPDLAVSLMRGGAQDYIPKGELARLVPAIARELREVAVRRARRQAEEARDQLAAIVESSDDAIIGKTLDGRITSWNAGAERLYGYPRADVIGQSIALVIPPDRPDELPAILARLQRGERLEHYETVWMRKDGTRLGVSLTVSPMVDAAGHVVGASAIARDITARRQAEAQVQRQREALFQSEKLAMMGQLLAGVAHELNNPLSIVMGQASLLRQSVSNTRQLERAETIVQAAERCARIVRNFLALARQRPPERRPMHVNQVVREVVELLAYPLRVDSVDVQFELAPDLPLVWGDRHQLHQVMVNLVTNAQQAMREVAGPRHLTLATGVDAGERQIWLEVRDTGPGVAAALQQQIFEPFVTTKPPGMGTGLGLSLSQEIVERHGGTIRLGQAAPQGAVFRVTLPMDAPREAALEATPPVEAPAIRGKRVLVVDDEPGIASVVAEVLALDEHIVETAAHGGEALAKVCTHPYDLIISDIRMPEVDGPNFYRALARRDPQLLPRLMFMTGDTLNASTREFLEQTRVPCVRKPFTLVEIRAIVQQTLQALEEAPAAG
jgi:PAS domain S-box-containing protein